MPKAKPHKAGYLWSGASTHAPKATKKQDLINAIRKRKAKKSI